jgi:5-methylcytosine-specific restriction endonuclease McrA
MGLEHIRNLKEKASLPKEKKYYTIRKVSEKRAKKIEEGKEILKMDEEMRVMIWANSAHVCQSCGSHLGNKFKNWNFHHLLPKAKYPQFRHEPANIMLLCLECHSRAEHTNKDLIPPKVVARTLEAEKLFL